MANLLDQFIKKVKTLPQQVVATGQLLKEGATDLLKSPNIIQEIGTRARGNRQLVEEKFNAPATNLLDQFIKKTPNIPTPQDPTGKVFTPLAKKIIQFGGEALIDAPASALRGIEALTSKERQQEISKGGVLEKAGAAGDVLGLVPFIPGGTTTKEVSKGAKILSEVEKTVNPVNKIIAAIREAKPIRESQELLYSKARGEKLAKVIGIRGQKEGEKGFIKELGALKGELPKVQYESIRNKVSQQDVDDLFNTVKGTTKITEWDKIPAQVGLAKIFDKVGGAVPTQGELRLLKEVFGNDFVKTVLDKRSTAQKAWEVVKDIANIPRTLVSSVDFSAPFRQGVFLVGRPKQFAPAFRDMFKYFGSEKAYQGLQESIKTKPTYQAMRDHGLAITDVGSLSTNEDNFLSNLAAKLPGVKQSARAYTGFLTKLRADVFDDIVTKTGIQNNPKALKSLANYVNSATGRGDLPKVLEGVAPILNAGFFSPRLIASRLNLLNPVYYAKLDPIVRKEALKDLVKTTGAILSVLGLTQLSGKAQVGIDPTSADFAKIKVGNTRYEITGGFAPYLRLIAQLITGKITSSTTGKTITLGEGYRPLTRLEILARFFQNKESPVFSFGSDLLRGTNVIGEPLNFKTFDPTKNAILQRFTPLFIQDLKSAITDSGDFTTGAVKATPGLFGFGSQTYGGTPTVLEEAEQQGSLSLYKFLKSRPKEEANKYLDGVYARDPQKYNKIGKFKEMEDIGLGEKEFNMVGTGIKNGERVNMIIEVLNTLPDKESKNEYLDKLDEVGLTNDNVYEQLDKLKREGKVRP